MWKSLPFALALLFSVAGDVGAQDDVDEKPLTSGEASIGLPSFFGVSGLRNMVDARTPTRVDLRALLGYDWTRQDVTGPVAEKTVDTSEGALTVGASALTFLELGAHFPFYVVKRQTVDVFNQSSEKEESVGRIVSLDLGLKAGRSLDFITKSLHWLSLAPYMLVHVTGAPGITRLDGFLSFEVGGAATVAVLDDRLSFHLDLAYAHIGVKTAAVRCRLGIFGVPIGVADDLVVRIGGYVDGLSVVKTNTRHDLLDVSFGVQGLLIKYIILEVTGGYRAYQGLSFQLRDRGTGGLEANVGGRIEF
ncbi:MAG TPA: hypothetical protein VFF73_38530 [Planctomycetota bacterium]|nr:hypothetical protein [Planctomycetota bacterium]